MPRRAAVVLINLRMLLALLVALATSCAPGMPTPLSPPPPEPVTVAAVAATPAVAVDPVEEPSEELDEPPVEDGEPGPIPRGANVRERALTVAPGFGLLALVLMLGVYIPAPLDSLLKSAASSLEGP